MGGIQGSHRHYRWLSDITPIMENQMEVAMVIEWKLGVVIGFIILGVCIGAPIWEMRMSTSSREFGV